MIAIPLVPIRRALAAHIRQIASSMGQRCKIAVRGARFGKWLPLVLVVTTAVEGCLRVGPLAQATLIATAVLRRITGR